MSQSHINEPAIFVQLALTSHSCVPLVHSSMSIINRMLNKTVLTSVDYSPEQVSPSNPGRHSQRKLPLVFTHMPLDPHMDTIERSSHSLTSRNDVCWSG